jgi:hypothetical protein
MITFLTYLYDCDNPPLKTPFFDQAKDGKKETVAKLTKKPQNKSLKKIKNLLSFNLIYLKY